MGLFETLDRILCGEEVLNKWAKERAEPTKGKFLTQEENRKKQELNFIREFYKLGNGNLFWVEELPKIFKEVIIARCGSLEKEKLKNYIGYNMYAESDSKKHVRGKIPLFSKSSEAVFFGDKSIQQGGFLYVENNKGEFQLKTYRDNFTTSGDSG